MLWYLWRVGPDAHYVTRWLPGTLIVGLGIGLTFPVMSAAAVSSLDAARYSVGSAVNQTARQIGGALGVAVLVVVLGTPHSPSVALENFRHLWIYIAPRLSWPARSARGWIRDGDPRSPVANDEIAKRREARRGPRRRDRARRGVVTRRANCGREWYLLLLSTWP